MKRFLLFISINIILFLMSQVAAAQISQTVANGQKTTVINSPSISCLYTWVNDNPAIGLPASGNGSIPSFTAINTGNVTVKATITATPVPTTYLYIPNSDANNISVISTASRSVVAIIPLPVAFGPWGVAVSPDATTAYIVNQQVKNRNGSVSVVNTTTNTIVADIPVGANPVGVVVSPDGSRVYVTNVNQSSISVIDATVNRVINTISTPTAPLGIAITPDGKKIYVASEATNAIIVIDAATGQTTANISVGQNPEGAALSPDGTRLYVTNYSSNTVSVINTGSNVLITTIAVGTSPFGIAVSPNGTRVYVANQFSNTVSVIDAASDAILTNIAIPNRTIGMHQVSPSPCGVSVSADGATIYVANEDSNTISVISAVTNTISATIPVDLTPVAFGNFVTGAAACNSGPATITIIVNPTENLINVQGTLSPLNTTYGNASVATNFMVSAIGLTTGVLITPPPGFEVSIDGIKYSPTITLGATGNVAATNVYVRLTAIDAIGSYSGDIILSTTGSVDATVATANSTVVPTPLIITANSINKIYGSMLNGTSGSLAFTAFGLRNSETIGSVTLTYSSGAAATAMVNKYIGSITPRSATGGTFSETNYSITYLPGDINVLPAKLTISANNQSKISGQQNPPLTVSYTGFVNNEGPSQLTALPIVTTTATTTSPAGSYPLIPDGAMSANYIFNYLQGILTVSQGIKVPNTFTPNGDGINDTWDIQHLEGYRNSTVEVLNRYGQRIFFSNNYPIPWNGKYKGANAPAGTYYYIIKPNDGQAAISGHLTIIR